MNTTQDTSLQAEHSIKVHKQNLEEVILDYIFQNCGATCDEIEVRFNMRHQTVSSRITALRKKKNKIRDSGERRLTRSGRPAIVWIYNSTPDAQMTFGGI